MVNLYIVCSVDCCSLGMLKNITGKELKREIEESLRRVNLHEDTRKTSSQYSGGMKRRLSVACALMGNPSVTIQLILLSLKLMQVILLDEPSTGLDPASRRQLWEVINEQKKRCAMLLTTHAMEVHDRIIVTFSLLSKEADALCDRLGIFVDGELKCVGNSSEVH
jgi:ABC-type multidrug transport system ATPase subunit